MKEFVWINPEITEKDWYSDGCTFSLLSFIINMSDSNWKTRIDINDHPKMFRSDFAKGITNLSSDGIVTVTAEGDIVYIELINSEYVRISMP